MERESIHSRLYRDFFRRQENRKLLLRHLEEQPQGKIPYRAAGREATRPLEAVEASETQDNRLKVPRTTSPLNTQEIASLFAFRKDSPRTSVLSPKETPPRPAHLPAKSRFRAALQQPNNPMIGKFYSQLTPFRQTLSYSTGCDWGKIQREGKEMLKYSDSQGMLAALDR